MGSLRENFVTLHFPYIAIQMRYQRHSERPAELHGLYIFAYGFFVCRRESTQPFTNRLIAGIGLEEADFQGGLFHVASVSILVRYSKPFVIEAALGRRALRGQAGRLGKVSIDDEANWAC